jgi:hypothetical protein
MRADSPESLRDDGSPVQNASSLPEEFSNINEMLAQLEQRKSINEGTTSLKNAGSFEYSVQEHIEEENSDPEEEDEESDFERDAHTNDMSPKKRHYSRHRGDDGSCSSSA